MKRIFLMIFTFFALGTTVSYAQRVSVGVDFYSDYYYYDDDIYRYGFNINNYASVYEDQFVRQVSNEYGIRKSVVRRYLRNGFSPSDILFGAELSYRTGRPFAWIMDGYYNSPSRNWIDISFNLGIPRGSVHFNYILGSFNRYCTHWNHYYYNRHPHHSHPPMYNNNWSYFRPSPQPNRRPNHNNGSTAVTRPRPGSGNNVSHDSNRRPGSNVNSGNSGSVSGGNNSGTPGRRPGSSVNSGNSNNSNNASGNNNTNSNSGRRPGSSVNSGNQGNSGNVSGGNNSGTPGRRPGSSANSESDKKETRPTQPSRENSGTSTSSTSGRRQDKQSTSSSNNSSKKENNSSNKTEVRRGSSNSSSSNSGSSSSSRGNSSSNSSNNSNGNRRR